MSTGPAASSGNPAGSSTARVYQPAAQPQADAFFQSILNPDLNNLGAAATNPAGSPAGLAYGTALPFYQQYTAGTSPGTNAYLSGAVGAAGLGDLAGSAGQVGGGNLYNVGGFLENAVPQYMSQFQGLGNQVGAAAPAIQSYMANQGNLVSGLAPGYLSQMQGLSGQLSGLTPSVIQQAFDPQSALYDTTLNKLQQQIAAGNAASGVTGTPYGADVTNEALGNFNIDWQNQQLQRMLSGAQGATGLNTGAGNLLQAGTTGAGSLYNTGANLVQGGALDLGNLLTQAGNLYGQSATIPSGLASTGANLYTAGQGQYGSGLQNLLAGTGAGYNAYTNLVNNVLNQGSSLAQLGNNQYLLPQQVLNDIQSYLGLGQSASQLSGQLGQIGQNQLATSLGGLGALAGSGLGFGSPSNPGYLASGIGSLFGGGGAGAAGDLSGSIPGFVFGPAAAGSTATDVFGGADLVPLLAAAA